MSIYIGTNTITSTKIFFGVGTSTMHEYGGRRAVTWN